MRAFEFIKENEIIDEMPLPAKWDKDVFKLKKKKSYQEHDMHHIIDYVISKAKKLGEGDARTVVNVKYKGKPTAFKVAHNERGLSQNEEEIKILRNAAVKKTGIAIPLIDYDKKNKRPIWVQVEYAKPVSYMQLKELLKTPSLDMMLRFAKLKNPSAKKIKDMTQQLENHLYDPFASKNANNKTINIWFQYAENLRTLLTSGITWWDLDRPANWGIYKGKPVLIDLGLTNTSEKKHYS